ncbi:UNVERIFIED_CONTAM: hypothetical protein Sindi_2297900 [Sesamum indicum]
MIVPPVFEEKKPQLPMSRVIIHIGVMNNIWIGQSRWFFMQPGRVIFLLLMMLCLMMVQGPALLMPILLHIVMAVAPMIMSQGWQTVFTIVYAADQPLWNDCTQSQLAAIVELVDIKVNSHISQQSYDQISQWANKILLSGHSLLIDYYSTKKLIKDLGLPVEKIDACKNSCMLYWKDNVDLEYYRFCGDARYKPTRGRDSRSKESPYVVLRYLPLTPHLQRLYAPRATVEHMTWHDPH